MKKSIAALLLLTIGLSAFAYYDPNVSEAVLKSFEKEFSFAKNVKWEVNEGYSQADFILADSRIVAIFDNEGELLSASRNLLFNQLPIAVINAMNNKFGSACIYDITEYNSQSETTYFMKLESGNKILQLKANPNGEISVVKKFKK